jgi:hypothetical protein
LEVNMQTLIQPQAVMRERSSRPLARVTWLPAVAAVLVPKCPMCVAAYLSAIGAGASAASAAAPAIVRVGHLAVMLAVAMLGARLVARARRVRRYRGVAVFAVCAAALLVAEFVAPMLLWPRLLALTGVAVSVVRAERAAAACSFLPQTPASLIPAHSGRRHQDLFRVDRHIAMGCPRIALVEHRPETCWTRLKWPRAPASTVCRVKKLMKGVPLARAPRPLARPGACVGLRHLDREQEGHGERRAGRAPRPARRRRDGVLLRYMLTPVDATTAGRPESSPRRQPPPQRRLEIDSATGTTGCRSRGR